MCSRRGSQPKGRNPGFLSRVIWSQTSRNWDEIKVYGMKTWKHGGGESVFHPRIYYSIQFSLFCKAQYHKLTHLPQRASQSVHIGYWGVGGLFICNYLTCSFSELNVYQIGKGIISGDIVLSNVLGHRTTHCKRVTEVLAQSECMLLVIHSFLYVEQWYVISLPQVLPDLVCFFRMSF